MLLHQIFRKQVETRLSEMKYPLIPLTIAIGRISVLGAQAVIQDSGFFNDKE
jgi:hypothetical protein